ncbi:MAG: hypothetical protein ACK5P5_11105 [Pseudobdellovibrionaceae bacterium]
MKATLPPTQILDHVEPGEYKDGQQVDLVIKTQTDLGYKAIVNAKYWGVLYHNEVFKTLHKDEFMVGYIKRVREDGKLDLTLYKVGHKGGDEATSKILAKLIAAGGFLPLTDKTSPEQIYEEFGVSKKKFKIALGGLYKDRLIVIEPTGIRIASQR